MGNPGARDNPPRTLREARTAYNSRDGGKLSAREQRVLERATLLMERAEKNRLKEERRIAAKEKRKKQHEKEKQARGQLGIGLATQLAGFSHSQKAMKNAMETFVVKKKVLDTGGPKMEVGEGKLRTKLEIPKRAERDGPTDLQENFAALPEGNKPAFVAVAEEKSRVDSEPAVGQAQKETDVNQLDVDINSLLADEELPPVLWSDVSITRDPILERGPCPTSRTPNRTDDPGNREIAPELPLQRISDTAVLKVPERQAFEIARQGGSEPKPEKPDLTGLLKTPDCVPKTFDFSSQKAPFWLNKTSLSEAEQPRPTLPTQLCSSFNFLEDDFALQLTQAQQDVMKQNQENDALLALSSPVKHMNTLLKTSTPSHPTSTPISEKPVPAFSSPFLFDDDLSQWLLNTSQIEKDLAACSPSPAKYLLSRNTATFTQKRPPEEAAIPAQAAEESGGPNSALRVMDDGLDYASLLTLSSSFISSSLLHVQPGQGEFNNGRPRRFSNPWPNEGDALPGAGIIKTPTRWDNQHLPTLESSTRRRGSEPLPSPILPAMPVGQAVPHDTKGGSASTKQPSPTKLSDLLPSEGDFTFSSSELRQLGLLPHSPLLNRNPSEMKALNDLSRHPLTGPQLLPAPSIHSSKRKLEPMGEQWGGGGKGTTGSVYTNTRFRSHTSPCKAVAFALPAVDEGVDRQPARVNENSSRVTMASTSELGLGLSTQALSALLDIDDDEFED